jgi:nucleotide-binding universal stress UspA family protein
MENPTRKPLNIQLAIDSSQNSLAALEFVRSLPLPPASLVTVLAVLSFQHIETRANLLAVLDYAKTRLEQVGIKSNTGLLSGHPAQALTQFAEDHHPDFIALGAKGLRATLGIMLGGVAQQIVEYAQWPVLIVRLPFQAVHTVVFVTDGSHYSQAALEFLCAFPLPPSTLVEVVHVLPPLSEPDRTFKTAKIVDSADAWLDEERSRAADILAQSTQRLSDSGIPAACKLLQGDAATEIIQFARESQADLIIAGSRGLSAIQGWLLGSVSRKIVHYSNCSVMIIKEHSEKPRSKGG